ncbi:hypothetical protein GW17_00015649 [Ensete ventricosum]|nr:hypothetical protein GW17_00015649 [Ensete ventricosum]
MAGAEGEPRKGVTRQATRENDGVANPPPPVAMVTFPDAARRRAQNFPPPLKLECEDSTEDMNPRNLWQVVPPSSTLSFVVFVLSDHSHIYRTGIIVVEPMNLDDDKKSGSC